MSNFDVVDGDSVSSIVFNQPYLTLDDLTAITSVLSSRSAEAGPLIVRASGPDFCTGLRRTPAEGPQTADQIRKDVIWPILDVYGAMRSAPFPVIGAVRGQADGLGFAIAASCDLIVASENAEFALPELSTGVPPLLALSALMAVLPRAVALHVVATSGTLEAKRLFELGAIAEVVPDADLDRAADALGKTLAAVPPFRLVKEYLAGEANPERAADTLGEFIAARSK
jgi:enoyl-CoA hydratase/carnithine racemase